MRCPTALETPRAGRRGIGHFSTQDHSAALYAPDGRGERPDRRFARRPLGATLRRRSRRRLGSRSISRPCLRGAFVVRSAKSSQHEQRHDGASAAEFLPSVAGFAAKRAIVALRKGKVATAPLLLRAGLSTRDLTPQHRIPAAAQGTLFEDAAEALNDSAFGLHLAEETSPREAGLLFYLASAAKTLGEALALFERYFRIVNEAVRLKLKRSPEGVVVEFDFLGLSRHRVSQNAEFGIAVIMKALREAAGRNISPTKAAFAGGRNSDLREFERFYGCPSSSARRPIASHSRTRRSPCRLSPKIGICSETSSAHLRCGGERTRDAERHASRRRRERSAKAAAARQGAEAGDREGAGDEHANVLAAVG